MPLENQAKVFQALSAASGEPIEPTYHCSTIDDLEQACHAAAGAFDAFRAANNEARAHFLDTIGAEIMALGDALLERAHLETGLPLARLTGERGRTVGQLGLFARVLRGGHWQGIRIDSAMPDRQPLPRSDLRLRKIALGPVAVFGASNFPLAFSTAGGDTASALAAGCPVIVKGHPAHPGTDKMVADAIRAAAAKTRMPQGTFGHLVGPDIELGAALVKDPRIAAVGFTGSRPGGLALMKIAQARPVPIPVFAEMASINPVVILPGALRKQGHGLGAAFIGSLTMGAGQFCTNPGLVLAIEGEGLDSFLDSAAAAIAGHEPQTMLTPSICNAYRNGTAELAGHASVTEIASGIDGNETSSSAARLFSVTAAGFVKDQNLSHEVFGASSLVVRCSDEHELAQVLENLEGQLTATLHLESEDYDLAAGLLPILERKAGRILANGWPTGVEVCDAMVHGGPFPSTSDGGRSTSVGSLAIDRFLRPVCYQDLPASLLPAALQDGSGVAAMIDGKPS